MPKELTPEDIWIALNRPYIKVCEIVEITNLSRPTVQRVLKDSNVTKYPRWGYLTEEVIKAFNLDAYYDRLANWHDKRKKPDAESQPYQSYWYSVLQYERERRKIDA